MRKCNYCSEEYLATDSDAGIAREYYCSEMCEGMAMQEKDNIKEENILHHINHVRQEDRSSCTIACIAMVAGESFQAVQEQSTMFRLANPPGLTPYDIDRLLVMNGIMPVRVPPNFYEMRFLPGGKLFIITVPSLNEVASFHCVVVDLKEKETQVFDPQKDNSKKKYYTVDSLKSFTEAIEIKYICNQNYPRDVS